MPTDTEWRDALLKLAREWKEQAEVECRRDQEGYGAGLDQAALHLRALAWRMHPWVGVQ